MRDPVHLVLRQPAFLKRVSVTENYSKGLLVPCSLFDAIVGYIKVKPTNDTKERGLL
jgi:hypothetical protein